MKTAQRSVSKRSDIIQYVEWTTPKCHKVRVFSIKAYIQDCLRLNAGKLDKTTILSLELGWPLESEGVRYNPESEKLANGYLCNIEWTVEVNG